MELETCLENLNINEVPFKGTKVLVVDIGIKNLGLCLAVIDENFLIKEIVDFNLINIALYTHNNCIAEECKLYHTKTCHDWLEHIFIEHPCFEEADIILIERQPIVGGIVVVEQIIFGKYRHKSHLISPNNVHKFLNIKHLDYDGRKQFSVNFGMKYLSFEQQVELKSYERMHDITDAIEILVYWTNKNHKEKIKQEHVARQYKEYSNIFEKLDSYRYIGEKINLD
jgi:hypothetical protein